MLNLQLFLRRYNLCLVGVPLGLFCHNSPTPTAKTERPLTQLQFGYEQHDVG
jgi:hypothetical protein